MLLKAQSYRHGLKNALHLGLILQSDQLMLFWRSTMILKQPPHPKKLLKQLWLETTLIDLFNKFTREINDGPARTLIANLNSISMSRFFQKDRPQLNQTKNLVNLDLLWSSPAALASTITITAFVQRRRLVLAAAQWPQNAHWIWFTSEFIRLNPHLFRNHLKRSCGEN